MPGHNLLRWIACVAVLCVLILSGHDVCAQSLRFASDAQTDSERTARDDFEQWHMKEALAALGTPGVDDDEKVIHGMMQGVNRPWVMENRGKHFLSPDQQARYYRESIIMARKREGGELRALELLFEFRQAHPLHRWFRDESPTPELYEQWYKQADRDQKSFHSDGYIGLLVERSLQAQRASDMQQAQALNREALSIARATKSGWEDALKQRDRTFQVFGREAKKIEQYQQRIDAGKATDLMHRSVALWQLLVADDQPGALKTAQQMQDKTLSALLTDVGKPVAELPAEQASACGKGLEQLANDPAVRLDNVKAKALTLAKARYQRYLDVHETQDVERAVVEAAVRLLDKKLGELGPVEVQPPAPRWSSLMDQLLEKQHPKYNDGHHVSGDLFEVRGNKVTLGESRFKIPIHVDADYELRLTTMLARKAEDQGIFIYFPLDNERGAVLALGVEEGNYFYGPPRIKAMKGFKFPVRKAFTIVLGVRRLEDEHVRLTLRINGKEVEDWTGPRDELKTTEYYEEKFTGRGTALVFNARAVFQFSDIAMRPALPLADDAD